jgi:hypothetical protein
MTYGQATHEITRFGNPTPYHAGREGVRMRGPSCGLANAEGMHFCGRCGDKLS